MYRIGKHISRICAGGTSKLAYDGSGEVERDEKNYSITTCTLSTLISLNAELAS